MIRNLPMDVTSQIYNESNVSGETLTDVLNRLKIAFTDVFYVDGCCGVDSIADGSESHPFKTIQACLNYIGQPITKSDYMRHILIYIQDQLTSSPGSSPQTWNGIYEENLVVPCRAITILGFGIKIGNNGAHTGFGNILKEYSSSRRFGAGSSDFRPGLTLMGLLNARDTHNRLRNGFHIGGDCRTTILTRNVDSVVGDGVNKITCHITSGQHTYPITIPTTYPTEPYIRIVVRGTTNYNATYDIVQKINDTTFVAQRVSGTNAATSTESGNFFESDSAGASGLTHDAYFYNTYMQGAYTCDDGVVNAGATTAGTEVLYSCQSRWFTGIEGRTIQLQRWEDNTETGTIIVNTIAGIRNSTFSANITTNTFTYSTDDQGFTDNKFTTAITFTVQNAAQTVRMDSVTYSSFVHNGCSWATNTPTVEVLDPANKHNLVTVTGAGTADKTKSIHLLNPGTDITVTLPAAATVKGCEFVFKNISDKIITLDGDGAETIDGASTHQLSLRYASVNIISDGSNWVII